MRKKEKKERNRERDRKKDSVYTREIEREADREIVEKRKKGDKVTRDGIICTYFVYRRIWKLPGTKKFRMLWMTLFVSNIKKKKKKTDYLNRVLS